MNLQELMFQAKKIAQFNSPFDTGNLRYNAIHVYPLHNFTGFVLEVKFTVAAYGTLLDEYGAGPDRLHKGWWTDGVFTDIAAFTHSVENNMQQNYHHMNEHVAKFAPDNPERKARFNKSMISDR
jgi:hypothetical protein